MTYGFKGLTTGAVLAISMSGCSAITGAIPGVGAGIPGAGGAVGSAAVAPAPTAAQLAAAADPAVAAAQQQAIQDAVTKKLVEDAIMSALVPSTDAELTAVQVAIREAILTTTLQQYRAGTPGF